MLYGCVPEPKVVFETKTEYIYPGAAIRQDCGQRIEVDEVVVEDIYTNKDYAIAHGYECKARLDAILNWYKDNLPQ